MDIFLHLFIIEFSHVRTTLHTPQTAAQLLRSVQSSDSSLKFYGHKSLGQTGLFQGSGLRLTGHSLINNFQIKRVVVGEIE